MASQDIFNKNPIQYLEELASSPSDQSYGNTPRPSGAEGHFISAMGMIHSKRFAEAEKKLATAAEISQKDMEANPTRLNKEAFAIILLQFGFVHILLGNKEKAAPVYQKAIEIWEDIHGKDSPKLKTLKNDYADILKEIGREDEALAIYNETLAK
eukprot:CAMPEP_0119119510 /NCGR_PEP_ID=MMETSP1310-20130426/962_1 /TAXON_ID=464262 /ORGANISM="Genus nov. species nov., Strain RCC2339" /LENGTH=154 /DNA_ID=CAMNT_0007108951 /DNA_START=872 /DNA_END=1336 /DNA_ORIENTATION=-